MEQESHGETRRESKEEEIKRGKAHHRIDRTTPLPSFPLSLPHSSPPFFFINSTLLAYVGPGYMVAVGYMDPGNWATDIAVRREGGREGRKEDG